MVMQCYLRTYITFLLSNDEYFTIFHACASLQETKCVNAVSIKVFFSFFFPSLFLYRDTKHFLFYTCQQITLSRTFYTYLLYDKWRHRGVYQF